MTYTTLVDEDTLDTLAIIVRSVKERRPFKMASSREISKEDRTFIGRMMQLDPRDRPSAKVLLQDTWLEGRSVDSG